MLFPVVSGLSAVGPHSQGSLMRHALYHCHLLSPLSVAPGQLTPSRHFGASLFTMTLHTEDGAHPCGTFPGALGPVGAVTAMPLAGPMPKVGGCRQAGPWG